MHEQIILTWALPAHVLQPFLGNEYISVSEIHAVVSHACISPVEMNLHTGIGEYEDL